MSSSSPLHLTKHRWLAELTTLAMKDVEHQLKFRCALDSEYQIGDSWADCH